MKAVKRKAIAVATLETPYVSWPDTAVEVAMRPWMIEVEAVAVVKKK